MQQSFKAIDPQFSFKYIGTGTGNAITSAESGSQGASVLIVHAPSLENQFVANGFSQEQFGRAIFTNDFVLAGPSGDPAGVAANGAHNIAQAFVDIANAGDAGHATFVSRGGTPGTTVEEHSLWQLVDQSGLAAQAPNLLLCGVSAANGGGETPIASGQGVTANGQQCPNNGALPTGAALPTWYVATGLTQGPNVVDADTCNGFPSGANSCYVLTDRGTYDYLISGLDPAGTIHLVVSTRDDDASAPGGAFALINYFHAYIINPSKPGETVNLTAAQDFVNMLTSPAFQAQLRTYLNSTTDPGGAPFKPSASPTITATGLPSVANAGSPVTVSGTVSNPQPGFPALAGQPVVVNELVGGLPVPVGSGTTDASGNYSVHFVPGSSGSYQVSTPQLAQVENANLNPVFADLISPGATAATPMSVQAGIALSSAKASSSGVTVAGTVAPAAPDSNGTVTILARKGTSGSFSQIGGAALTTGQFAYAATGGLTPGTWQVQTSYRDPGQLLPATSNVMTVTVPSPPKSAPSSPTASFKKLKVKNGVLTVSGVLGRAASGSGARVELFALQTSKVKKTSSKAKRATARVAKVSFRQVGKTTVKNGHKTFTVKAKLKRGFRWVLQLEFVQKGKPTTFSKLRTVDVH
jgi:ABC-type tungstate transport system permease subunit